MVIFYSYGTNYQRVSWIFHCGFISLPSPTCPRRPRCRAAQARGCGAGRRWCLAAVRPPGPPRRDAGRRRGHCLLGWRFNATVYIYIMVTIYIYIYICVIHIYIYMWGEYVYEDVYVDNKLLDTITWCNGWCNGDLTKSFKQLNIVELVWRSLKW